MKDYINKLTNGLFIVFSESNNNHIGLIDYMDYDFRMIVTENQEKYTDTLLDTIETIYLSSIIDSNIVDKFVNIIDLLDSMITDKKKIIVFDLCTNQQEQQKEDDDDKFSNLIKSNIFKNILFNNKKYNLTILIITHPVELTIPAFIKLGITGVLFENEKYNNGELYKKIFPVTPDYDEFIEKKNKIKNNYAYTCVVKNIWQVDNKYKYFLSVFSQNNYEKYIEDRDIIYVNI